MDYIEIKGMHNISKHPADWKYQDFGRFSYKDLIATWPMVKYHDKGVVVLLLGRTCHKIINNVLLRVPWLCLPLISILTIEWILFTVVYLPDNIYHNYICSKQKNNVKRGD